MPTFIDEPVEVELAGDLPEPVRFRWRNREHRILEILGRWSDWNFGEGSIRRTWRNRRHRNYYRVRTTDAVYELYLDRGAKGTGDRWILYQCVEEGPRRAAGESEEPRA
jgi:hypothetical protein